MSLMVDLFVRDPDGGLRILDTPDDVIFSGGFESWRKNVWGSGVVRALGARLLPLPAYEDLYVEPDRVGELLAEIGLLRPYLYEIAHATRHPRSVEEHQDGISHRLRIIEERCHAAREIAGGVLIW
ncbi:hypothetical protein GTY65_14795 [Streptomyces sp. SID8379]|uniref:hypothetical protein n=1 Tax=unclassified Streptomyces TaxID=2593676 RepID=UPI000475B89F|nr:MULTISPECIES: hypothetical protein [unclassified Streptomyces]MYW65314.1 hypothetical protein [Streptomyces sp. SID8379]